MTQVAQIFEEEKQQALTQVAQIFEEEKRKALTQAAQSYEAKMAQAKNTFEEENRRVVIRMIKKDYPTEEIVSLIPNYSQNDVERLRKEISNDNL